MMLMLNQLKSIEIENVENLNIELSINSVVRLTNPGTMKVKGKIQNGDVVFIDCGATHNFISEKWVNALGLPIKETSNYGVILGSGMTIKGTCVWRS